MNAFKWLATTVAGSKKGIRDVVVSMIPQGIRVATGFVTSVLMARGLGPAGLGQVALVQSLAETSAQLSDMGIGQTAIRYISRADAQGDSEGQMAVSRWAFRRRVILVLVFTVLFYFLSPWLARRVWHAEDLTAFLRLGLLSGVFIALSSVPSIYFQSLKRFGINASLLTAQALIFFAGILGLAFWKHWSVASVVVVGLIASGICAAASLLLVPRAALWSAAELKRMFPGDAKALWRSPRLDGAMSNALDATEPGRFAFFMLLSSILVILIVRADIWLMGAYLDESQVGIYNAATRFALPLSIVLNALNMALWPRASALDNLPAARALLKKTFRLSFLVACGGVLYALFVPLFAPLLFGAQYEASVFIGQLLCLRYCFSLLICPIGVVGYSFGLARIYWLINLAQLAIVVALNVWLLPRHGPAASAFALIVNDAIGFMVVGAIIWRRMSAAK